MINPYTGVAPPSFQVVSFRRILLRKFLRLKCIETSSNRHFIVFGNHREKTIHVKRPQETSKKNEFHPFTPTPKTPLFSLMVMLQALRNGRWDGHWQRNNGVARSGGSRVNPERTVFLNHFRWTPFFCWWRNQIFGGKMTCCGLLKQES